jgi:hypothetical protein
MRKSTLFISTALTIFMMATIFGVASAYQQIVRNQNAAQVSAVQAAPVAAQVPAAQPVSVPTSTLVTPDQAASIASIFLNDTGVYSVETVDYQGVVAYLVTFSSGNLVYVSTSGEILAISQIPPVVIAANPGGSSNRGNNNNNGGEHEEHEDGDD